MAKISDYASMGTLDGSEVLLGNKSAVTKTAQVTQIARYLTNALPAGGAVAGTETVPIFQAGQPVIVPVSSLTTAPAAGTLITVVLAAGINNNVPLTGLTTGGRVIFDTTAGICSLTGLVAQADGFWFRGSVKRTGFALTLKDNTTSTAANRLIIGGDFQVTPGSSFWCQYDAGAILLWSIVT